MDNKDIKFEELKKNFEISLKLIEENVAEKLIKKNQIDKFKNDMSKIKNYIDDTEKHLRDLEHLIKTK